MLSSPIDSEKHNQDLVSQVEEAQTRAREAEERSREMEERLRDRGKVEGDGG